ncbi:meiotic recombination protein SPO11-1 isoform X2 [Telopea speciosissima]|uniref:meiotic recombination protein SPO11-1 isoform X2 n=1 Tax=Telopea speciosissima TaxID=54955 RepID=UPI001CC803B5|nr:meiotic recombination protein SPO11-1 isoform X2 [Telopea speciosissima]
MEGRDSSSKPCDLLKKIRGFTRSLLSDICRGKSPLIALDRYRNYCTDPSGKCCCSSDLHKGKEIISLQRECHVYRLDVLLRVLHIVQQLLQENKHGSKRDIYYMHPSIFLEQSVVDRAINDICILLKCSRHNLNVVSVGKGLVMGWLRFIEGRRKFDCIKSPCTVRTHNGNPTYISIHMKLSHCDPQKMFPLQVHPVPVHVEEVTGIMSIAEYILVVEKETVFQRLANDRFCSTNRCIIITGRGYPDVPTRRFLRLLVEKLCLPAYCLVDCDPYGFDILTTYRFGSMQMAYDAKFMRVTELRWLGAFPSDSKKYCLPEQCLLPLTTEDKRRAEGLLQRCYLQREEPEWRLELEMMLEGGVKFEIEALSVSSISFLSEKYIPSKIQGQLYI